MPDSMKKFGLEFQLVNRSQNEFAKIMDQQKRLEKQLNNTLKAFNKLQSTANNTSLESSIKKMDKPAEKNVQFYLVVQTHLLIKE